MRRDAAESVTEEQDSDVDESALRSLLDAVRTGEVSPDDAVAHLRRLPYADLGFARVDHHRALRQGQAEAVYAPGKAASQCAAIVAELLAEPGERPVVLTRAAPDQLTACIEANPGGRIVGTTACWRAAPQTPDRVLVITAGTADLPVADECATVLEANGVVPVRITDVGVAGLHRVVDALDELDTADAVVVVAGMEGALASVIGGLTPAPVIAVPTSAGYGSSLEGVTALLGMLASCAAGVTVVGIDNGFGAATAIVRLLRTRVGADR
jgi:NCAIR mutase (PurE)-related protein